MSFAVVFAEALLTSALALGVVARRFDRVGVNSARRAVVLADALADRVDIARHAPVGTTEVEGEARNAGENRDDGGDSSHDAVLRDRGGGATDD